METSVTTKLSKRIGSYTFPLYNPVNSNNKWVAPPEANGGLVVNDFLGGEPCYYFTCEGQRLVYGMLAPSVIISGNTINWSWDPDVVNYHVGMEMFPSQPTAYTVGGITLHYGVFSCWPPGYANGTRAPGRSRSVSGIEISSWPSRRRSTLDLSRLHVHQDRPRHPIAAVLLLIRGAGSLHDEC